MKLLTKTLHNKLLANHAKESTGISASTLKPPVKFFNPCGAATWLVTSLDPDGLMFGLCDLGMGYPELGYISLDELKAVRVAYGLSIERDLHFTPTMTLGEYAQLARESGRIAA